MNKLALKIRPISKGRNILVELNATRFERLAGNLGFYSPAFLESLERAERDYRAGRVSKISSLRTLRRKR